MSCCRRGVNDGFADEASLPFYTAADVAKHATKDDLWVIIDGKVYDLTRYVDPHPGGEGILNHAGGDSTEGFHGPQHPDHVHVTLRKFLIGKLKK
jgi:cytochrome b involved in lipid metabolism